MDRCGRNFVQLAPNPYDYMWCNICEINPPPPQKKFLVPAVLVLCYSSMCLVQICGIIAVDFLWNYQQSYENIPLNSKNTVFQN